MPETHDATQSGGDKPDLPLAGEDEYSTHEVDEDEDDLFGDPPGSDLEDPADDDW